MSEDVLLFEIDDGVARLTLNRPAAGNAINMPMARALVDAAVRCQTDRTIRCVVLTGAGRLFCTGGDLADFAAAGDGVPSLLSELAGTLHMALARLSRMAKPLIVLVNGPAAGAGLSLAISGDVVLATPTAHFTAAYGAIGLTPDGGMSWLLPRLVGLRRAQEIILTNRRVSANEAVAMGLISRVVEADALLPEGRILSSNLAASAVAAIGGARALLQDSFSADYESQLEREARSITAAGAGNESREGLSAFLAKRAPNFKEI